MPRPLEPNQRFPYVLERDREKDPKPTFYFRSCSAREFLAAKRKTDEDVSRGFEVELDYVRSALVDWQNMSNGDGQDIPFDAAELDAICARDEIRELFWGFEAGYDDKKKSG